MAERNPFAQFRLRRLALQLRQFTVNELKDTADVSPETVYGFIHELKQQKGELFKAESLSAQGPGRPIPRYTITPEGIDFLAGQNAAVADQFNEVAFQENPSLRPVSRQTAQPMHVGERVAAGRQPRRIEEGLNIKGEITGNQNLEIDGSFEGLVQLDQSKLVVTRTGKVAADIIARHVVVYGLVRGNMRAADRIDIMKDGSVTGDITTARIAIEDGAYFRGSIEIDKSGERREDRNTLSATATTQSLSLRSGASESRR